MEGYRLVVAAAGRIAETDPEQAVVMLAQAVLGAFYAGDTPAMVSTAERAVTLTAALASRRATFFAEMSTAMALVADGRGEAGAGAARRAVEILEGSDEFRDDPRLLAWAALGPMWLREVHAGRGLIDRAFEQARAQGAVGVLPFLLHHLARDQATTDRWPAAEASYDEAIRLARESGQRVELTAALAGLAWLQARQGREVACRRHCAEASALCDELGVGLYGIWAIQALGDLELGLGRAAESVVRHEAQAEALRARGIADVDLSPAPGVGRRLPAAGPRSGGRAASPRRS